MHIDLIVLVAILFLALWLNDLQNKRKIASCPSKYCTALPRNRYSSIRSDADFCRSRTALWFNIHICVLLGSTWKIDFAYRCTCPIWNCSRYIQIDIYNNKVLALISSYAVKVGLAYIRISRICFGQCRMSARYLAFSHGDSPPYASDPLSEVLQRTSLSLRLPSSLSLSLSLCNFNALRDSEDIIHH